jgi:hypothetical protein
VTMSKWLLSLHASPLRLIHFLRCKGDPSAGTSASYLSSFPALNSSETSTPRGSDEELHVFGASLEAAVAMTRLSEADYIPGIVRRCVEYLDEFGTLHGMCACAMFFYFSCPAHPPMLTLYIRHR